MKDLIPVLLHDFKFNLLDLYDKEKVIDLEETRCKVKDVPKVRWAINNGLEVNQKKLESHDTGIVTTVYVANMTEKQYVDFLLKF
jgi:hypothetical protein